MAKETKEITPLRAVLIYSLALVLIVLCELPRVLSWVKETRCKLVSIQGFDGFGTNQIKVVSAVSYPGEETVQARNDLSPSEPGEVTVQAPNDSSQQALPEGTEADRPVVSDCPEPRDGDPRVAHPDSSGAGDVVGPVASSEGQTNGQATSEPATASPKLKPHKILLLGDSMIAEGFGPALQRELIKHSTVEVIRKGQYSTGFVHQEDFNWVSTLKELIQKHKPDMIVIHMGCNDPIDILDDSGRRLYFGNDKWQEIYASRVREFLKLASEKKILSFWVGLPIMSSQKYCAKIRLINSTVERECAKASGCHYVDSWSALADSNGNYSTFIKRPGGRQTRIRAKDDVHLTEAGGVILSKYFLRTACEYADLCADDEQTAPR